MDYNRKSSVLVPSLGFAACLLLVFTVLSCTKPASDNGKLKIVATTGIIGDCIANIAGDNIELITIMGPGVDPHLYKASQGDIEKLTGADIIIYNGLHLEGKMGQILKKLSEDRLCLSFGEFAPKDHLKYASPGSDLVDPHIWFHPEIWMTCLEGIADSLKNIKELEGIEQRFAAYKKQVISTQNTAIEMLDRELPLDKRILITSHDAFSYFGDAFRFQVRGLQGISTAAEYGVKDVTDLIQFIQNKKIRSIFVESSISDKNLKAVVEGAEARGYEVRIGGTLYSDALGGPGSGADTYTSMMMSNIKTIIEGLK